MAPCEEGTVSGGRLLKVGGVFSNQPASEARGCENAKTQTKKYAPKNAFTKFCEGGIGAGGY